MADAYSSGGGGGVVRTVTENTRYGLDKPYDFDGGWGPDQIGQLNEMLTYLFRNTSKGESNHLSLVDDVADVVESVEAIPTDYQSATITIAEAALETANTAPITIVAAEAGKITFFTAAIVKVVRTVAYSNNPSVSIRHRGLVGNISAASNIYNFSSGAGTVWGWLAPSDNGGFASDPTGLDLVLFLNGDLTGAGSATMEVSVGYYLLDPS